MYILGISAFYHDSAAALIKDGKVIYAAEEERFTREKHSFQFPYFAIKSCLKFAKIGIKDVSYIAYYEKPLLRFERVLESIIDTFPFSLGLFLKGIPEWIGEKIKVERHIKKDLRFKGEIIYVPHHLSHASASYYASGFNKSAIMTVDGIGEYQTTGLWVGENGTISNLKSLKYPHSLGLLYSTFTAFLGFRVNEDEYKVMGLSAYGKPSYVGQIRKIVHARKDGSFQLQMNYFSFHRKFQMWSRAFEKLFGSPRDPAMPISQKHKDIAASLQKVTEEIYLNTLRHLHDLTKLETLCLGGGVALNALANGKIYKETSFKSVYIIGPAGDGGNALGAAYAAYNMALKKKFPPRRVETLYLGSDYNDSQIEKTLRKHKLSYQAYSKKKLLAKTVAYLIRGNVIGWFQGRMEYGPRALGARSLIADPKDPNIKIKVNKIKIRQQFQPFAGSILQSKVYEYFDVPENNHSSPFMLFCFQVKKKARKYISTIVHKDGTCRIQTVNVTNGLYYELLNEFYKKTGRACILNTSFNLKGEPIVENPEQAVKNFLNTNINVLIIGNYIVSK